MADLYCFLCLKTLSKTEHWARHRHTRCHQRLIVAYQDLAVLANSKLGATNGVDGAVVCERLKKIWGTPHPKDNKSYDRLAGLLSEAESFHALLKNCEKEETFADPGLRKTVDEALDGVKRLVNKLFGMLAPPAATDYIKGRAMLKASFTSR